MLGPVRPDVVAAMNNLAKIYYSEGKYAEAEPLSQKALTIREEALPADDSAVVAAMNNLAKIYYFEGSTPRLNHCTGERLKLGKRRLGLTIPMWQRQ